MFEMGKVMFTIVPIFFVIVIGLIVFSVVRSIGQWSRNNGQPVLNVHARIVSKRTNVSHYHHDNDSIHDSSHTTYYVTFEVESGDRMELKVSGTEFGMLAEEDIGSLQFQGTRYLGFQREPNRMRAF
ncbi:DUF2500 domain-containing protein [Cohnella lubricantis]|uniref:DUF2500 domain-containing protein n=3 Tax=Cohnella lubricantis TaxID=2163172 RepID=A0A841T6N7_9BACL|nr:DUF2500 domain-containing protein [Cohnella lubricantis]MBB6676552.1 DUF2500 domain-containing protein [Cohnella lubricantis]